MTSLRLVTLVLASITLVTACKFPELPDLADATIDGATFDGDPETDASTDASQDGPPPTDAPIDAFVNALGQVCTPGMPSTCPGGHMCMEVNDGTGGSLGGWCSPMCMNQNALCMQGYSGPAGGMPVCAISDGTMANYCAIVCVASSDCPTGLTCQPLGNPPQYLCAKP